jgi:hypothetical protein
MLPLVEIPQIVQHYAPWFEAVFSAAALVQFSAVSERTDHIGEQDGGRHQPSTIRSTAAIPGPIT